MWDREASELRSPHISSHSEASTRNRWYVSLVLCAHYVWLSPCPLPYYLGHKVVLTSSVALWAQIMEELFFFPFLLGRIIIHLNAAQRRKENKEKESLCPFSSSINILWMRKKALRAQRFTGHWKIAAATKVWTFGLAAAS